MKSHYVALAGGVLVSRGRSADQAARNAGVALSAAYSAAHAFVEQSEPLPFVIDVYPVTRETYLRAPASVAERAEAAVDAVLELLGPSAAGRPFVPGRESSAVPPGRGTVH